jgi:hypothetical protein
MTKTLVAALAAALSLGGATAAIADHKPGHPDRPEKGKPSTQQGQSGGKLVICHRTMSTKNPHRTLRVTQRAWDRAHSKHGDQPQACQDGEPRGTQELDATLAPVTGATGSGTAHFDVRLLKRKALICYTLDVTGVDATAAHIHIAIAQTIGGTSFTENAIVVPLKTPGSQGVARGCTSVSRAIGAELLENPGSFYVNVHSAAFPGGQVQGTLG